MGRELARTLGTTDSEAQYSGRGERLICRTEDIRGRNEMRTAKIKEYTATARRFKRIAEEINERDVVGICKYTRGRGPFTHPIVRSFARSPVRPSARSPSGDSNVCAVQEGTLDLDCNINEIHKINWVPCKMSCRPVPRVFVLIIAR